MRLALAALALVLASCDTGPGVPLFAGGDFYAPPDPLPAGDPGDVLWAEPLPAPEGVLAWRVLYRSESVNGQPAAVSGIVAAGAEPPAEPRPILALAHGTTGIADQCAPSMSAGIPDSPLLRLAVSEGYVLTATDYEGLGTPGTHPYLVGESEARSVLDLVRAARQIDDAQAGPEFLVWGHSQGGHAALFTGEAVRRWAPELTLRGVAATAAPGDLIVLAGDLEGSPFQGYMVMAAVAYSATYPHDVSALLGDAALDRVDVVEESCVDTVLDTFADTPYADLLRADPATAEPWRTLLIENTPGLHPVTAPVLLLHGSDDEQIPVEQSALVAERLCALGVPVQREVYEGHGHGSVLAASLPDLLGWISERFADEPARDDC
ncbi:MAG TPA: lipase family protein [Egibacteraceae bacterium]|nr:lipase family protein [Egibacteraceae bacterium]